MSSCRRSISSIRRSFRVRHRPLSSIRRRLSSIRGPPGDALAFGVKEMSVVAAARLYPALHAAQGLVQVRANSPRCPSPPPAPRRTAGTLWALESTSCSGDRHSGITQALLPEWMQERPSSQERPDGVQQAGGATVWASRDGQVGPG
jgi:hypothetical protein